MRLGRTFLRSTFGQTFVPSSRIMGSTFFVSFSLLTSRPILSSLICLTSHLLDSPPRLCSAPNPSDPPHSLRIGSGRLTLSPPWTLASWYVFSPPSLSRSSSNFFRSSGSVNPGLASFFSIAWKARMSAVCS